MITDLDLPSDMMMNSQSPSMLNSYPETFQDSSNPCKNHHANLQDMFISSPIVAEPEGSFKKVAARRKRQPWSKREDKLLEKVVKNQGCTKPDWRFVASQLYETLATNRTGKQCRERWQNHLRPDIKKGKWTSEEEDQIQSMIEIFGPKWSCMSRVMKGRTDNDIKNKWNSMQRSQVTHKAKYGFAAATFKPPAHHLQMAPEVKSVCDLGETSTGSEEDKTKVTAQGFPTNLYWGNYNSTEV